MHRSPLGSGGTVTTTIELEQRIRQLDERLRRAREENNSLQRHSFASETRAERSFSPSKSQFTFSSPAPVPPHGYMGVSPQRGKVTLQITRPEENRLPSTHSISPKHSTAMRDTIAASIGVERKAGLETSSSSSPPSYRHSFSATHRANPLQIVQEGSNNERLSSLQRVERLEERLSQDSQRRRESSAEKEGEGTLHLLQELNKKIEDRKRDASMNASRREAAEVEGLLSASEAKNATAQLSQQLAGAQREKQSILERKAQLVKEAEELRNQVAAADEQAANHRRKKVEAEERLLEKMALLKAKDQFCTQENATFEQNQSRLRNHLLKLQKEKVDALNELQSMENEHASENQRWQSEEERYEKGIRDGQALLAALTERVSIIEAELEGKQKSFDERRSSRQQHQAAIEKQAEKEENEEEEHTRSVLENRKLYLQRDNEERVQALRYRLGNILEQVEAKRGNVEAQKLKVEQLQTQRSRLQLQLEGLAEQEQKLKEKKNEIVRANENIDHNRSLLRMLDAEIEAKNMNISNLGLQAQHLAHKLEEESELQKFAGELAQKLSQGQDRREGEVAEIEERMQKLECLLREMKDENSVVVEDSTRQKNAEETEVELLKSRIETTKQALARNEQEILRTEKENEEKEATIRGFEEERINLEREQKARREAAAKAAQAALLQME